MKYFPGLFLCAAAVVERRRTGNFREPTDDVVPEKSQQGVAPSGCPGHRPDPGTDNERLQDQTRVQLPTPQLRPTTLPGDDGTDCQRGRHPARGALRHEPDRCTNVHHAVTEQLATPGGRVEAQPCSEEPECASREQTGIGGEPRADTEQDDCSRRDERRDDRRGIAGHHERKGTHRESGDGRVQNVGSPSGGGRVTKEA